MLHWYNALRDTTNSFISKVIDTAQSVHFGDTQPTLANSLTNEDVSSVRPNKHRWSASLASSEEDREEENGPEACQHRSKHQRQEPDEEQDDDDEAHNPFSDPLPRDHPSNYLRARCPLCFGGSGYQQVSQAV